MEIATHFTIELQDLHHQAVTLYRDHSRGGRLSSTLEEKSVKKFEQIDWYVVPKELKKIEMWLDY